MRPRRVRPSVPGAVGYNHRCNESERRSTVTFHNPSEPTIDELRAEIIRLGPWHLDVEVVPGLTTRAFLEAPPGTYQGTGELDPQRITFIDPRPDFDPLLAKVFGGDGLDGRSFLDCACNAGAYCFLAREAGAGSCFGFDVREHWIAQARFLAEHRAGPSDRIDFEVLDLYDLPERGSGPSTSRSSRGSSTTCPTRSRASSTRPT